MRRTARKNVSRDVRKEQADEAVIRRIADLRAMTEEDLAATRPPYKETWTKFTWGSTLTPRYLQSAETRRWKATRQDWAEAKRRGVPFDAWKIERIGQLQQLLSAESQSRSASSSDMTTRERMRIAQEIEEAARTAYRQDRAVFSLLVSAARKVRRRQEAFLTPEETEAVRHFL